jgi:hypothetical protein
LVGVIGQPGGRSPRRAAAGGHHGRPYGRQAGLRLIFVVIRGGSLSMSLALDAKFLSLVNLLLFTRSLLDFAGEFRRGRIRV